ncbi:MAG: hypothetical protein Q8O55_08945 [Dehalococcoidales bacterium]|nr:hypothetical protein [Dehalococcoidales bacterium]
MKARLEDKTVEHRGIIITSETEEEKEVIRSLWINQGRPAMFSRDGALVSITIAPTPEEAELKKGGKG